MGITSTASGNVKATQDYSTIRYSYQSGFSAVWLSLVQCYAVEATDTVVEWVDNLISPREKKKIFRYVIRLLLNHRHRDLPFAFFKSGAAIQYSAVCMS